MHSLRFVLAFAPLPMALAAGSTTSSQVPVSAYLEGLYGTAVPAGATGAVATKLASAIESIQNDLQTDTAYISAVNDIYMAAATATDSDQILSSLGAAGPLRGDYTTAAWYKSGVPTSAQSEFASMLSDIRAAETSVLGPAATATDARATVTTSGSGSVTPAPTQTPSLVSGSVTSTGGNAAATATPTPGAAAGSVGAPVAGLAAVVAIGAAVMF